VEKLHTAVPAIVAAAAAPVRAVHPVTEVHRAVPLLPAVAHKAADHRAVKEVAPVQVKAEAVPGKNLVYNMTGFKLKRIGW